MSDRNRQYHGGITRARRCAVEISRRRHLGAAWRRFIAAGLISTFSFSAALGNKKRR